MTFSPTPRRGIPPPYRRTGFCRWCDRPVKPPRTSWCSQECVDQYLLQSDPNFLRRKVAERDHGVCAACGLDCEALDLALRSFMRSIHPDHWRPYLDERGLAWIRITWDSWKIQGRLYTDPQDNWRCEHMSLRALRANPSLANPPNRIVWEVPNKVMSSLWAADHIVPLVDGGASDLSNTQLLCRPCHNSKTAREAAARAGRNVSALLAPVPSL